MRHDIRWTWVPRIEKWVITVYQNNGLILLLLRKTERECREWAETNIDTLRKGQVPSYR